MGTSFYTTSSHDLVQRTRTIGATVYQDDMAVIAGTTNGFGYPRRRPREHAGDRGP